MRARANCPNDEVVGGGFRSVQEVEIDLLQNNSRGQRSASPSKDSKKYLNNNNNNRESKSERDKSGDGCFPMKSPDGLLRRVRREAREMGRVTIQVKM